MADLLKYATHDQIAVACCVGALAASAVLMHLSVFLGQFTGKVRIQESGRLAEHQLQRVRVSAVPHIPSTGTRDRAA